MEAILDGLMSVTTLAMMYVFCPALCVVSLVAMLLYTLGRVFSYPSLYAATMEQIVHSAKQDTHVLETLRGIRALKLFQRHNERTAAWLGLYVDQTNAALRVQRLAMAYRVANSLLFGAESVIVLWLGAKQIMDGLYTVGILMAYSSYRLQFNSRVAGFVDKCFELKMLGLQNERLADIVLSEPETPSERLVMSDDQERMLDIELRGVRFRYADNEPWVLDGVNLAIKAGESVAIVGPSGCGKTTLISLVLGIMPPTDGEILIGGASIRQLGVETLRRLAGTVMQDDVLFSGSISDNISFFDAQADQRWVEECAKIAAIHVDIAAMPMGYNTLVGDMGTVLSGGQKQRVLLARALYKRPRMLVLDEATSHLDIACERQINETIGEMKITRVMVAHRLETRQYVERVIALENGLTSERGARAARGFAV